MGEEFSHPCLPGPAKSRENNSYHADLSLSDISYIIIPEQSP